MNSQLMFTESLTISLFSMIIVFIGLLIISLLISALKLFEKKEPTIKEAPQKNVGQNQIEPVASIEETDISKETIAVIAAAIAMYQQIGIEEFDIKNIKRVNNSNPWQQMGIAERLMNKL